MEVRSWKAEITPHTCVTAGRASKAAVKCVLLSAPNSWKTAPKNSRERDTSHELSGFLSEIRKMLWPLNSNEAGGGLFC